MNLLRYTTYFTLFFIFSSVLGCMNDDFPGNGITVRNDIQDKEYNDIELTGNAGGKGFYKRLSPGEKFNIPSTKPVKIKFSRKYADFTRTYLVECPARENRITLKLIDVHLNRMSGGCITTQASR